MATDYFNCDWDEFFDNTAVMHNSCLLQDAIQNIKQEYSKDDIMSSPPYPDCTNIPADFDPDDFLNIDKGGGTLSNGSSDLSGFALTPPTSPSDMKVSYLTNLQLSDVPGTKVQNYWSDKADEKPIFPINFLCSTEVMHNSGRAIVFSGTSEGYTINNNTIKSPPILPKTAIHAREIGRKGIPTVPVEEKLDERILKKRMRMIKNRESADLSRRRKREYVTALERKVVSLEKENIQLKADNLRLRKKLGYSSHNDDTITSSNVKKNTAVLLAMVFMVSLNFTQFQKLLTPSTFHKSVINPDDFPTNFSSRRLLWAENNSQFDVLLNQTTSSNLDTLSPCVFINQTENMRLEKDLRKLTSVNHFRNSTTNQTKFEFEGNLPTHGLFKEQGNFRSKTLFGSAKLSRKLNNIDEEGSIQLFKPRKILSHSQLLRRIGKKNDTFYVVSFSKDHILLPATSHNKSTRPKMSLMLPSGDADHNGQITLMQIDCEVLNTTTVHLNEDLIPIHLRNYSKNDLYKKNGTKEQYQVKQKFNFDEFEIDDYDKKPSIYKAYLLRKKRNNDKKLK